MNESQKIIARHMSESDLQKHIVLLAKALDWLVMHTRPARTGRRVRGKDGKVKDIWNTPLSGNKGFPDLVLAKHGRVIFAELKSQKGNLTKEQESWRDNILSNGHYYTWRPEHWLDGTIERILKAV